MKKIFSLVGVLSIAYTYAQVGNVGINTESPKATLDINPIANQVGANATSNQGILAPRLSKTRIANIANEQLVEGTLVYVSDLAYAGNNIKVSNITEKGYYYYNGTEWVKTGNNNAGANSDNIYNTDGILSGVRTIDFNGNQLNLKGQANIGSNGEAISFVGTDHTYTGWYPQGVSEGRKAYMGFTRPDSKDFVLTNEFPDGKVRIDNPLEINSGYIWIKGGGDEQVYIGGDGIHNDVEIGSIKSNVRGVALWNRADAKHMNVTLDHITAVSLAGSGDRPVIAAADGTLKVGTTNTGSLWEKDSNGNTILKDRMASGTNRNDMKIDNRGVIMARGFIGYDATGIFPDYVFQKYYTGHSSIKEDYQFKSLNQVEDFVKTNGHLPNYQSAEEIKNQGFIDIMKTQLTNVEKIEELYLHLIEKDKEIQELKQRLEKLEKLLK